MDTEQAPGTTAEPADVLVDVSAPVITRDDIVIAAPLQDIWQVQTDVENWPAWQPGVTLVDLLTAGPLRPG